ncbi:MAG TPA: AAA family ATPase [Stenomitos sp.]
MTTATEQISTQSLVVKSDRTESNESPSRSSVTGGLVPSDHSRNSVIESSHCLTLTIDRSQARNQLELLGYKPGDNVYMRFFVPDGDPRHGTPMAAKKTNKLNWEEVERHQNEGYGVYFVINGGGHSDKDVQQGRALFCEWDDRPIEDQVFAWQSLNLPEPSMQVGTRKSVHNYWRADLTKEQWTELQEDLLAYTQSDQKLKNPSRVLRLAGAWHIKPGCEPVRCDIIHHSDKIYTYEELRAAIPRRQQPEQSAINYQPSISDDVPLYQFLTKDDRALLDQGASQGSRNNSGAKLARNLIGTAQRLNHLGIRYSDDPRHLLHDYCYRCTPSLSTKEAEAIWKSALKDNPTSSLTDDALENCAKAWLRNQEKLSGRNKSGNRRGTGGSGGNGGDLRALTDRTVNGNASPQKLPLREAVEKATQILETQINSQIDSIEASILLEELRREAGVNEYNWEHKYLKPLREKLERSLALPSTAPIDPSERKRLELKAIAQERDPYKFTDKLIEFCRRTGWSRRDAEQQIRLFKTSTITPKAKRLKGKDFLRLETESISWVFPGIIPGRGVFVLGGNAGAGKTTCAYDAVGSLLLGEEFLGEKPVRKGKALVVTGDELPCYTQDKLIDRGIPLDNEDWDIILNWDVSQWDVLEEAIADLRPTLVIIDSFSSIHRDPSFDENSSQAKSTIYDLEALTNSYDCGCILIHHLSKSKENQGVAKLRGSSAIAAAASVVCLMEEVSDGSRKLSFPKVRGAQTKPFLVHLQGATGRYEVISGGDDGQTKSLGDRILEFLQKSPHHRFEQEEISQALGIPATNKDSVYQALRRLFNRDLITKRPSHLGGKRKVYGLANPSQLSHCSGLREVTDTVQETPPPPRHNVSVQNSETIDIQQLDLTDTLTDTLTDSELTPQNDVQSISGSTPITVGVSAKLTDKGSQGCVCPISEMAAKTVTSYDLNNGEAVGQLVRILDARKRVSNEAWKVLAWCARNGLYTLENGEKAYPFELVLAGEVNSSSS